MTTIEVIEAIDVKNLEQLAAWLASRQLSMVSRVGRGTPALKIVELRRSTKVVAAGSGTDWATAVRSAMLKVEEFDE